MTQVSQGQQMQSEEVLPGPAAHEQLPVNEPAVHQELTTEIASDNDANEKSAREKFKKTSIASLQKHTIPSEAILLNEKDSGPVSSLGHGVPRSEDLTEDETRGRPAGKRALEDEDLNTPEPDGSVDSELQLDPLNGHTRKRSRDVRSGEHMKGNGRPYESKKEPLQEEAEEVNLSEENGTSEEQHHSDSIIHDSNMHESAEITVNPKSEGTLVLSKQDLRPLPDEINRSQVSSRGEGERPEDEEMKDGADSPRKKRSRDQMDPAVDREQKIAATEETRAQRRSEELDRSDTSLLQGTAISPKGIDGVTNIASATDVSTHSKTDDAALEPPKAVFGATNILRPSLGPTISKTATKPSDDSHSKTETILAPTQSAFASSGFANFASSSNSPFGGVASSATSGKPSLATFAKPPVEVAKAEYTNLNGGDGAVSFPKAPPSELGRNQLSSFASAGSNMRTTFGGAPFGGGFGSGFGGGSKLTSFAAPTGDAKLGGTNGSVKPMGSSNNDDEEKDGSDTEDEGEDDGNKYDETSETDENFKLQDVDTGEDGEDTIFSSRAKLYAFKNNNWKEAGKGVFKLNVIISEDAEDEHNRSSRFIMRAHQTYRVLLNQPVFSQMKMGDQLGKEPKDKNFSFAVIEDSKPVPHMVKFGDMNESKKLYHEVIKLQHLAGKDTRAGILDPIGGV